jgi:hypothetical protein
MFFSVKEREILRKRTSIFKTKNPRSGKKIKKSKTSLAKVELREWFIMIYNDVMQRVLL